MEDFVPYELAVKLKEKGFKEKCYAYYFPANNELCHNINQFRGGILYDCLHSYNSLPKEVVTSDFIDAPTISQALKWLREDKKIYICISYDDVCVYSYDIVGITDGEFKGVEYDYETYEQAAIAGVEYCLDSLI